MGVCRGSRENGTYPILLHASLSGSCSNTELHMERAHVPDQCSSVLTWHNALCFVESMCEMELVTPFCKWDKIQDAWKLVAWGQVWFTAQKVCASCPLWQLWGKEGAIVFGQVLVEGLLEKTGRQNLPEIVREVHLSATPLCYLLSRSFYRWLEAAWWL